MDAAKALQYYRLYALLISDGVSGAAPAISAAAGASGAEAAMVARSKLNCELCLGTIHVGVHVEYGTKCTYIE